MSTRNIEKEAGRLVGHFLCMAPSGTAGKCPDCVGIRIGRLANEDVRWDAASNSCRSRRLKIVAME